MKKVFVLFSAVLLMLSSCTVVMFEVSQPKDVEELKEFPNNLIGVFLDKKNDTVRITKNSLIYTEKKAKVSKSLDSGEIVLKKYNDYYILNLKTENVWEVIPLKCTDKAIFVSYINLGEKADTTINKIREVMKVKEILNKEGKIDYYLVNPTKKEFDVLIKKDIFTIANELKRIE